MAILDVTQRASLKQQRFAVLTTLSSDVKFVMTRVFLVLLATGSAPFFHLGVPLFFVCRLPNLARRQTRARF